MSGSEILAESGVSHVLGVRPLLRLRRRLYTVGGVRNLIRKSRLCKTPMSPLSHNGPLRAAWPKVLATTVINPRGVNSPRGYSVRGGINPRGNNPRGECYSGVRYGGQEPKEQGRVRLRGHGR